jgi:hypothetical protein
LSRSWHELTSFWREAARPSERWCRSIPMTAKGWEGLGRVRRSNRLALVCFPMFRASRRSAGISSRRADRQVSQEASLSVPQFDWEYNLRRADIGGRAQLLLPIKKQTTTTQKTAANSVPGFVFPIVPRTARSRPANQSSMTGHMRQTLRKCL